jgi:hypothetical protein
MLFSFAYEAAGAAERPAFPVPSDFEGSFNGSGVLRGENAGPRPCLRQTLFDK